MRNPTRERPPGRRLIAAYVGPVSGLAAYLRSLAQVPEVAQVTEV